MSGFSCVGSACSYFFFLSFRHSLVLRLSVCGAWTLMVTLFHCNLTAFTSAEETAGGAEKEEVAVLLSFSLTAATRVNENINSAFSFFRKCLDISMGRSIVGLMRLDVLASADTVRAHLTVFMFSIVVNKRLAFLSLLWASLPRRQKRTVLLNQK